MDDVTRERMDDVLEKPWALVLFTLGIFAAIYLSFWALYIFGPLLRKVSG